MAKNPTWREIIASAFDWDQAHTPLAAALKGLAPEDRGKRPKGYPHSIWQLVEHYRLAQHDLLDFCRNPKYTHDLKWPDDYWPKDSAPPSEVAWKACLAQIKRDRKAFVEFTMDGVRDLTAEIPRGTGQTFLRTILVALDHNAYHLGQIVDVRRLIGSWPAKG
ncbi:MAG: DinB family protein [bacterium]